MNPKKYLYGLTLDELKNVCKELALPQFTARQICSWLYTKNISDISQFSNISLKNREILSSCFELGLSAPQDVQESVDGTKKYLFVTHQGDYIESAYIPDGERATLCVSSQSGCRMGCKFCATARLGLRNSLSVTDILNQIASLPERDRLTNVVFMGMGEPLDNWENVRRALEIMTSEWGFAWSPTRITLSSAGVASRLDEFLETTSVHLAISLHNPFHNERAEIMPIEKAYPIEDVVKILRKYDFTHQRRVSFEYILMEGLNDSDRHVKELCRLLNGIKCRINIIRFHKIPDSPFYSPEMKKMVAFRDALTSKGIMTTIRTSRGEDIKAACGLLSADKDRDQR